MAEPRANDATAAPALARLPTFRTRLTMALLGVVLLLTLALLAGQVISSTRLIRSTIRTITTAHLNHDQALVAGYFDDAQRQLFAAEHWAQAGQLTPQDDASAARLLMPLCDSTVQISGAYLSDCGGSSVTLRRSSSGWESITINPARPGIATYTSWPEPHNLPGRTWTAAVPNDSGVRELCAISQRTDIVHWTGLVEDGPGGPGVMVARALRHPGPLPIVLAFEISLWDLDRLLDEMHPTPHGYAVLFDAASGILERDAPPGEEELAEELEEPETLALKQQLLAQAELQWTPSKQSAPAAQSLRIVNFVHKGQRWWAGMAPLELSSTVWGSTSTVDVGSSDSFYLVAFIPESDLFSELEGQRYLLLAIAATVLLVALLLASRVARSFSLPVAGLVAQTQRLQRLELDGPAPAAPAGVREIAQLSAAHDNMRRALDSFSRYVPIALVRELLQRDDAARIGGRSAELTILITDIRNFTPLCEELSPAELTSQLEEYFECLLKVLDEGGATVDKLVGDSVVCFWGAPEPDEQQTLHAVSTALRALAALDALNERWRIQGRRELQTKIGIARGEVVVGNVGASWRLNYTALGDAVNLASRLQQLCPSYAARIIASEAARDACGREFAWRLLDRTEIRGRRMREDIFEPLGSSAEVEPAERDFAAKYERALQCYWSGNAEAGQVLLTELLALRPNDASLLRLQQHLRGWHD